MKHKSKMTRTERARNESPICPCGNKAIKRLSAVWTCQRCLDWDANIPSTDRTRATCGHALQLKRGEIV